ncbi:MAG: F0F1 ATP synthase subunit delta [Pseudomonadota bacterium]
MSEPQSMSAGIAERYATALFDLALETKALDALDKDIDLLRGAIADSGDLRDLLASPLYARDDAQNAIGKVAEGLGVSALSANTLRLMAQNRRLFVTPALLTALSDRLAAHRGEVSADVVSAKPLTKTQTDKLTAQLKKAVGKDVKLNATVDESLIGGLIVKLGSKMIDTSIRSQLSALKTTMKEAR